MLCYKLAVLSPLFGSCVWNSRRDGTENVGSILLQICDEQLSRLLNLPTTFLRCTSGIQREKLTTTSNSATEKFTGTWWTTSKLSTRKSVVFCPVDPTKRTNHGPICYDLKAEVYQIHSSVASSSCTWNSIVWKPNNENKSFLKNICPPFYFFCEDIFWLFFLASISSIFLSFGVFFCLFSRASLDKKNFGGLCTRHL